MLFSQQWANLQYTGDSTFWWESWVKNSPGNCEGGNEELEKNNFRNSLVGEDEADQRLQHQRLSAGWDTLDRACRLNLWNKFSAGPLQGCPTLHQSKLPLKSSSNSSLHIQPQFQKWWDAQQNVNENYYNAIFYSLISTKGHIRIMVVTLRLSM